MEHVPAKDIFANPKEEMTKELICWKQKIMKKLTKKKWIIAGTKQRKQTPFFLSNRELKELKIPKEIWELPNLDLYAKLTLARIHSFEQKGGEPTNDELVKFIWIKLNQIIYVLANRPVKLSLFGSY